MPYRRVGKTIQHKKGGKWSKKQTATSIPKAKRAINLLRGVEHGWTPTGAPARDVRKRTPRKKTTTRPRTTRKRTASKARKKR